MSQTIKELKAKITRLSNTMISQMENADPGEHRIYYQGYAAGYSRALSDVLELLN